MIDIDIVVEAGAWPPETSLRALAGQAVGATLVELGVSQRPSELSLLFTDDEAIRRLNGRWRGKDKPTNVLSFPVAQLAPGDPLPPLLGDIVFAYETVAAEAEAEGKPFEHHLSHLVVHGLVHLMGYDHEDDEEAEAMEEIERAVLARLAIPDPYR